jgi:hypothetical protein
MSRWYWIVSVIYEASTFAIERVAFDRHASRSTIIFRAAFGALGMLSVSFALAIYSIWNKTVVHALISSPWRPSCFLSIISFSLWEYVN